MNEAQGPPGHSASVVNDPQLAEVVAQQLEVMLYLLAQVAEMLPLVLVL